MHTFAAPGPENTREVLRLARQRGDQLGIDVCLVASNSGRTALEARTVLQGWQIVAVTHSTGFTGDNIQELPEEQRRRLEQAGVRVLTATHAMGALGRAVRRKLGSYQVEEIIAYTLRIFGQGTKVAVEIVLMAADAGLVAVGVPLISVGGTGRGADTALVLTPANTQSFFDLQVQEIICKPGSW